MNILKKKGEISGMTDENKRKIYNIISIIVFMSVFAFACLVVGPKLLESLNEPDKFRDFIKDNLILGILAFLLIQIFQVFFALIPGEPVEIFAGYAFGAIPGLILCTVGVLIATVAIFALTRRFGKKFTYILVAEDKLNSLKFMQNEERVEILFFLLYFIPGTPKDLITYFAGLTKVGFKRFLVISSVARIPSVITSTIAGNSIQSENYLLTAVIFGATAIISLGGIITYHYILKKKNRKSENNTK